MILKKEKALKTLVYRSPRASFDLFRDPVPVFYNTS